MDELDAGQLDIDAIEEAEISQKLSIKTVDDKKVEKMISQAKAGKWGSVTRQLRSIVKSWHLADVNTLSQSALTAIESDDYEDAWKNLEALLLFLKEGKSEEKNIEEKKEDKKVEIIVAESTKYTVKSLDNGKIGAYAVLFGDEDHTDLSSMHDFFTAKTDFWLDKWNTRPMIYDHAQNQSRELRDNPVVGTWSKATMNDIGVWLEGEIDKAHQYRAAVMKLIEQGLLSLSSESAPHLVLRRKAAKDAHEIVRWPLLAASLTTMPAEPRLRPVDVIKSAYKSIGLEAPDIEEVVMEEENEESKAGRSISNASKAKIEEAINNLDSVRALLKTLVGGETPPANTPEAGYGYPDPNKKPVIGAVPKKSVDEEVVDAPVAENNELLLQYLQQVRKNFAKF